MTQPRKKLDSPRGVLRGRPEVLPIEVARYEPPADLAPFVEHFWTVHWDLRAAGPRTQEVLPHPSVHWVVEPPRSELQGIIRARFTRVLRGRGHVHSIKFSPAGFSAFTERPMHELVGVRVAATTVLGTRARGLAARLHDASDAAAIDILSEVLRSFRPALDPTAAQAGTVVAAIARDPTIVKVAQVCALSNLSALRLQRLFRRFIGVTPKWVIQRYRLHEVLERIHARPQDPLSWAELAADLGFTDQAHFARTFRAFVGVTPGQYLRRLTTPAATTR